MKRFNLYFGLGIVVLAVFALLIFKFWLVTANIAGGFLLYFMIDKFMEFLERKGIKGFAAYSILVLMFATATIGFILFVSIPLVEQTEALIVQLPELAGTLHQRAIEFSETFPFLLEAEESVKQKFLTTADDVFSISGNVVTSIITIVIIAFILLASRQTLHQEFTEKIPNDYFEVSVGITHRILDHVKNFTVAKIVENAIMTVIYFIGFWAIGMPSPLLLAFVGGLLNIIPYIGPLITVIPIGIAAMISGGYSLLGFSMLIIIIAQLIDNAVLQTWLVSKFVDIHPLMVVIITLLAGELAGVVGMIIAVPVYVITKIVITGLYDYLKSVQRHERILRQEESQDKNHARSY